MSPVIRWRPLVIVVCVLAALGLGSLAVPRLLPAAHAATKTLYIPPSWQSSGDVPWATDRTKESANFVLLWGEKSGTDPIHAASPYNFDPDDILNQLEFLYAFYVGTMKFTPETGLLATYKIDVIITNTWNNTNLNAWATGGSADNKVGVINIAPAAALPGSWGLAHELGHVFQNYTFLGKSGVGFTDPSAGTFWETSAEYMAMQVYPDTAAGDLTRFLRTENLAYSSSRHHYGAWMLMQYIVDHYGGIPTFNSIWNSAKSTEHPLETYRRIEGLTQDQLNAEIGAYAQHQVTYDYTNKAHFQPFINSLYPFVTAYNGVWVNAVNTATNHYTIPDAIAPSDYGYNKIKLVPSSDGALIRLHFKGHVNSAAQSGWAYGFVAVKNGVPRYSPVSSAADGQISFQTQSGESEVYLVVAGTPGTIHHYAYLDGYTKNYRYPYEFRIDGAVPSGFEPNYVKPAAPAGGHWHSNGGGWVDNRASVAATAYVGPHAAVYGTATVSGNARIDDLAWVNSGGSVSGNAVVKGSALIQGGVSIGGSAVVGGDAEPAGTCDSGTYLLFNPDRSCDGGAGESDVNPSYSNFSDAELAIDGSGTGTTPTPTPSATVSPSASPTAVTPTTAGPTTAGPASPTPSTTPSPTAGAAGCAATYAVTSQWQGGFQANVTVKAGSAAISGWTVRWTFPSGQTVSQSWNTTLSSTGASVTAANVSYNGSLAAGAGTAFGFIGTWTGNNVAPTVTCTAT